MDKKRGESWLVKLRNKRAHKILVKLFMKAPVTNIKFSKNKISFDFYNHKISDRISVKKQPHVAEWSRRTNKIVIDKNLTDKDEVKSFRALCIHEAVERFLVEEYGLNTDNEAHLVATQKEKEYLKKEKGDWRSHEMKVFWDWHKLGEK